MWQLDEIQTRFRDAVVRGDTEAIAHILVGGSSPQNRLAIHQRNYQTSLADALLVKFPATGWLIGTPVLLNAAQRYVWERPPNAPCIAEYGAGFPQFLATWPSCERLPYVREFAELEWYVGKAAIAVDKPPVSNEAFSAIEANALPDAVLSLQSGLHHIHASWPIDELMNLYLTETAPDHFDLAPGDVWIEVRGERGGFQLNRLAAAEFIFRKSVAGGRSIGDAAESALDVCANFDPGRALAALVTGGLVTGIR